MGRLSGPQDFPGFNLAISVDISASVGEFKVLSVSLISQTGGLGKVPWGSFTKVVPKNSEKVLAISGSFVTISLCSFSIEFIPPEWPKVELT